MGELVLKKQTLSGHPAELYPAKIRKPLEAVEEYFTFLVQKQLDLINQKVLYYAKERLTATKSLKEVATKFLPGDFNVSLAYLNEAIRIGIQFQRSEIFGQMNLLKMKPDEISKDLGIDFDIAPEDVMFTSLLDRRQKYLEKVLAKTTYEKTNKIVEEAIRNGESYDVVAKKLQESLGFDSTRAMRIARTETSWAVNEAQRLYAKSLGCSEYTIVLASGACDECREVAGISNFSTRTGVGGTALGINKKDILPIHVNCILGGQEVLASDVSSKIVSHYNGPIIRITTKEGSKLAVTPNHLVLSSRGWILAKNVKNGDHLISTRTNIEKVLSATPNRKPIKSLIEDIVVSNSVISGTVPASSINFNGDEIFTKNVNIIFPTSKLRDNTKTDKLEGLNNFNLVSGLIDKKFLNAESLSFETVQPNNSTLTSNVTGGSLPNPLVGSHTAPLDGLGFGLISQLDALGQKSSGDSSTTDMQILADLINTDSSFIFFDNVINVERDFFHGEVYDLTTKGNWYSTNNIITHNCRCTLVAKIPESWTAVNKSIKLEEKLTKSIKSIPFQDKQYSTMENNSETVMEKMEIKEDDEMLAITYVPTIRIPKPKDGYTPQRGKDYFTEQDIEVFKARVTPVKGKDYVDGYTPKKGKDYFDGEKGRDAITPTKGVDYFTESEIKEIVTKCTPQKGRDYLTKKEIEDVKKSLKEEVLKKSSSGVSRSEVDLIVKDALTKMQIISPKTKWGEIYGDITKQKDLVNYVNSHGGVKNFIELEDVPASYSGQADKFVKVTAGADGLEFASAVAGGVTKIIAGTNVTIDPIGGTGDVTINASGGSAVGAFTDLTDVPASYTGQGTNLVSVKSDASGLEFTTAPSVNSVNLKNTYTVTGSEPIGSTYYDSANHTTSTVLENGVVMQNGQELYIWAKNTSGAPIANGTPVSITSANGSFTTIGPVDITTAAAYAFVGLTTQAFAINEFGYVTKAGVVHDLDTSLLDEGKPVYVSATGGLTKTYPSVPNYVINVGMVEYKHATQGRINVIPLIVPKMQDLSDVNGTPLTTSGQIFVWNNVSKYFDATVSVSSSVGSDNTTIPTGLAVKNADLVFPVDVNRYGFINRSLTTISFDGTNTITLAPKSPATTWSYYRTGVKYTITGSKTKVLATPMVDGALYYIYIDATDGTLSADTGGWTLNDTKVPVATVFWNNTLTPKFVMADERHTAQIDRAYHREHHFTEGTVPKSPGTLSGLVAASTVDANKTFGLAGAGIFDEDLYLGISELVDPDGATPTYYNLYRTSATTYAWEISDMPFKYTGTNPYTYIEYDVNGTSTPVGTANRYVNTYVFLSNSVANTETDAEVSTAGTRIFIMQGRAIFTSAALAAAEKFVVSAGMPVAEGCAVWQLTWFASSGTSVKGRCTFVSAQQVSANIITTTAIPAGDHNLLAGLDGGGSNEYYHMTLAQHTIATQAADTTVSGYLSTTDWDTFNGKQNALVNSAGLASALSDETGTDYAVFSTSPSITTPKIVTSINDANGNEVIVTPATASAVNEVTITNSATGTSPSIAASGGDTNISLALTSKGTGDITKNGLSIEVALTTTKTWTIGASGCDFTKLSLALAYLADKWLGAMQTLEIEDGELSEAAMITVNHPQATLITITGKNMYTKTINSVQSAGARTEFTITASPARTIFYRDIVFNLVDVTDVEIGDYAYIKGMSGGYASVYCEGCHYINNVDTVNKRITCRIYNYATQPPSGNCTTTSCSIIKSSIKCPNSENAVLFMNGTTLGSLKNIVLCFGYEVWSDGSQIDSATLLVKNGAVYVDMVGCLNGLSCVTGVGGKIYAINIVAGAGRYYGVSIQGASYLTVASNTTNYAIINSARYAGLSVIETAAYRGLYSRIYGNASVGITSSWGGVVQANNSLVYSNATAVSSTNVSTVTTNLMNVIGSGTTSYLATNLGNIGIIEANPTRTGGATTSGNKTVTMTTTEYLEAGMNITGTGIPASTTIASVNSTTQITTSANSTATNTGLTFTFPPKTNIAINTNGVGGNSYIAQ